MDAIRNRNQKVMKHLGKIPYVTESMMPGTNIDVNQFVEKQKEKYGKYIKPITSLDASFSKSRSKQN